MPTAQKSFLQKLTTATASTLLTCPAATVYSIAHINIANIDAANADSVEVWVTRSATDIYDIKGVIIPAKAAYRVEGPFILEASDVLKIKAATANRLDVRVSYLSIT
ncbi:hypothetical protein [Runella sp.]|uniref:hypothetical protein n=1 Tax=Runella sp. TaxID=1960881 RepID=UPI003019695D